MKTKSGFTFIEISIVIVFLFVLGIVFLNQKLDIENKRINFIRKTAINAMYYNLEEFYNQNHYYPKTIDENNLTAMDPQFFTDPNGVNLGNKVSDYRYEPTNCDGDKCKSYTLRSVIPKEEDFVKKSRN